MSNARRAKTCGYSIAVTCDAERGARGDTLVRCAHILFFSLWPRYRLQQRFAVQYRRANNSNVTVLANLDILLTSCYRTRHIISVALPRACSSTLRAASTTPLLPGIKRQHSVVT